MRSRANLVLQIGLLFVAYAVTARLGLRFDAVNGFATLVWPPTGIALAALLLRGNALWPGVFLGAFVANWTSGAPLLSALGISAGNTAEALLGVALLKRMGFRSDLGRIRDVVVLVLFGAGVSTLASASIGVLSLWAGGALAHESALSTARAWWVGDALADLVVAPLFLVWAAPLRGPISRVRVLEALLLFLGAAVCAWVVFWDVLPGASGNPLRHAYMLFPALIFAALRFPQRGVVTAVFLISLVAIAGTAIGRGPFVRDSLVMSLLFLQSFMGVSAATALVLGAGIQERNAATASALEAVRARDEFLSIASHELKTPLTSLMLQLGSLARTTKSEPAITAKVDLIKRQVDRLSNLVENLLDVSRVVAGRLSFEPEEIDLRRVVDDVASRFREQLVKTGSDLKVEADPECRGWWDPLRIEQITTNLLMNAIKYGDGKPIEVGVRALDNDRAVLRVRDQGLGIADQDQGRIFERFERVQGSKQIGGLGLGLWIVKQIVTAMGGTIGVKSVPAQGSEFTVVLPRRSPAPTARA